MHAEDLVLAIISAFPDRSIKGKKRLQKLAFFLKAAGLRCDVHFSIRDFGPFSREIAAAAQSLSLKGRIKESEEPIGASGTYVTVYRLRGIEDGIIPPLTEKYKRVLISLQHYPTIDLEVAATFEFFRSRGFTPELARKKTIELKPSKAKPTVMRNVGKIVDTLQIH